VVIIALVSAIEPRRKIRIENENSRGKMKGCQKRKGTGARSSSISKKVN
jgi:hypothetical protein